MKNITLFIGDNAYGKTRKFKQIIEECRKNEKAVVTNIEGYKLNVYMPDEEKFQKIKSINNALVDKIIIDKNIKTPSDYEIKNLVEFLYASGKILVLDEIDAAITEQEVVHLAALISQIRKCWDHIYVNGYSYRLLRMFTYEEDDVSNTEYNVYLVEKNQIRKLERDEIIESFDELRG